jgi:hypothetical protein
MHQKNQNLPEKRIDKTINSDISDKEFFEKTVDTDEDTFDDFLVTLFIDLLESTHWSDSIKRKGDVSKIPIFEELPMVCHGQACRYAAKCPVIKALKREDKDDSNIINTDCRVEKLMAVRLFSDLVKDLQIKTTDTSDVLTTVGLVRLYILRHRIDWILSIDGMDYRDPRLVIQKTGQVEWGRDSNPLLKEAEKIEKQIAIHYSQLMASRRDKSQLAIQLGSKSDLTKLFLRSRQQTIESQAQEVPILPPIKEPEEI